MTLTVERLKEVLSYDPETGVFTWLLCPKVDRQGKAAGSLHKTLGYSMIRIDGATYYAHRLAWLYVTGEWPKDQIDHADTDRANNRFANLREATKSENMRNTAIRANNTSGYKGVSFNQSLKLWQAYVAVNGKRKHVGYYSKPEEASSARSIAAAELHGVFARAA